MKSRQGKRDKLIAFRVSAHESALLSYIAEAQGRDVSSLLRWAWTKYYYTLPEQVQEAAHDEAARVAPMLCPKCEAANLERSRESALGYVCPACGSGRDVKRAEASVITPEIRQAVLNELRAELEAQLAQTRLAAQREVKP